MLQYFEEYIKQSEPDKKEKGIIWQTAIGLQQVDGLKPSAYLIETAKQNIEGDITFDEVKSRIDSYYETLSARQDSTDSDRTEEADKVSARIAEVLSEKTFSFTPTEYINIHRRLFSEIYKFAGKIRDYNITKSEWALNGETVLYAGADNLRATLEYDFEQEKMFNYKGLSKQQIIEHIAHFVAYLWQIHIFGEGNTRTTAVFLIKYLRKLGFKNISNDLFAEHSWYFRNSLVRANYEDLSRDIHKTDKYLIRFLSNLLLKENNVLKNRELHINFVAPENAGINVTDVTDNVTDVTDNVTDEKFLVIGKKFLVNNEKFPVNNKKFPVIGLEILSLIEKNPNITIIELSKQLNISDRAVKNNLNKFKNAGIISRVGSDKTGSWKILKKGGDDE
ncbi:MAG: Fic family protein [Prevotellaceae bacterium]|jgi:fido (protein-threonine AMPylation protein)|nr:Fic family protein [Prevotellaceae bacterium]